MPWYGGLFALIHQSGYLVLQCIHCVVCHRADAANVLHKLLLLIGVSSQACLQCVQGAVLSQFPQLSSDSIAVIWTMAERYDPDSSWRPFWASLPQNLDSGLSMPEAHLHFLQDTSAHAECSTARRVKIKVPIQQCVCVQLLEAVTNKRLQAQSAAFAALDCQGKLLGLPVSVQDCQAATVLAMHALSSEQAVKHHSMSLTACHNATSVSKA